MEDPKQVLADMNCLVAERRKMLTDFEKHRALKDFRFFLELTEQKPAETLNFINELATQSEYSLMSAVYYDLGRLSVAMKLAQNYPKTGAQYFREIRKSTHELI